MALIAPHAAEMTDTEMQALWAFIEALDGQPMGLQGGVAPARVCR